MDDSKGTKRDENQRAYYRRYEECGMTYGPDGAPRFRPELKYVLEWVPRGSRVLDIGCGDGAIGSRLIRDLGCTVDGIEIDPAGVAVAARRGVSARAGDIDEGLPYPDSSFDVAIVNVTLHMVYRPGFVLREALRVAPTVIVSFPNFGFWVYRLELLLSGKFPKHSLYGYHWHNTRHIHMFSIADLHDLLRDLSVQTGQSAYIGLRNRKASGLAKLWPNLLARTAILELKR